ncbi:MAG: hypothetical protein KJ956_14735, partial [Actinobacteria bacterium]|nr:hypothetical protein [Actinomycetota bacterium]
RFSLNKQLCPGLTGKNGTVYLNPDKTIKNAAVVTDIKVGSFINAEGVKFWGTYNKESERFSVESSTKTDFTIGTLASGNMTVKVEGGGLSGTGTIKAQDLKLAHGITLNKGQVNVKLDSAGNITGTGTVEGELKDLGKVSLAANLNNDKVTGKITLTLNTDLNAFDKLVINSGKMTAEYNETNLTFDGKVITTVDGWAKTKAEITAGYDLKTKKWSATGSVSQTSPEQTLGKAPKDVKSKNATLTVTIADNTFKEVKAECDFVGDDFKESLKGTYDVANQWFTGKGQGEIIPPTTAGLELGKGTGIFLKSFKGLGEINDNECIKVTGSAKATLPYKGVETFEVTGDGCTFDAVKDLFGGQVTVKTLKELTIGDTAGIHAIIAKDSSATGKVKDNRLEAITGGIKFTVKEAATTLGEGTVSLTFTTDGKISGDGSFTIANAYKVPDKKEGPVTIKQGMTIKAKVTDNVLTEIGMANVGFIIENFALDDTKQKCGKIEGTISTGKIDLKNNNEVDVDGTAKVTGGWSFGTGVGTFTFGIGGSVTVSMKKSEVKKLDVKIPFSVKFTGNKEVKMSGTVDGNIDAKNQTVGGSLTLTPDDNYDFKLGTDFVEICKEGTTATATFSNNALNKLTTNVHLKYYLATKSAEGLLLEGTLTNGTYDPAKQAVSAKGKISLKRKLEKKTLTGDWKLIIKENATVEIDVVENKLDKIEGNIDFEIHEGGSALFTGSLKNANVSKNGEKFAGNVEVKLARKVFFPKRDKEADIDSSEKGFTIQLLEGGWVKGSIVDSKLGKLGAGIQFGLRKDKQQFAAGEIKGNFDFDNDKFGGDGKVTLTKEYPLFQTQKMATSGGEHDPDLALWTLAVKQGSTLGMKVEDNNLRKTKIDVGLCAYKGADKVAEGKIDGDYMVGFDHGFTGNFSAG